MCCWIVESWLGPTGSILKTLGGMPHGMSGNRRGKRREERRSLPKSDVEFRRPNYCLSGVPVNDEEEAGKRGSRVVDLS